jgi:hypothetical protein
MRGVIGFAGVVAVLVAACDRPQPIALYPPPSPPPYPNQYPAAPPTPVSGFSALPAPPPYSGFQPQICMIHHRQKADDVITGPPARPDTVFVGPVGQPQWLTREQCEQENEKSLSAEKEAFWAQRAAQQAQQKQAAIAAQIVRDDEARGYKHVSVKDLLLDGKAYAANETKVSVSGFYHAQSRQNERLYDSYDDFLMHTLNPSGFGYVEALNVGLITEDGSRTMREYFLGARCSVAGCGVTILGHIGECVETNAFGRTAHDLCLVAEDMRQAEQ